MPVLDRDQLSHHALERLDRQDGRVAHVVVEMPAAPSRGALQAGWPVAHTLIEDEVPLPPAEQLRQDVDDCQGGLADGQERG
jgi:hypothetical protein